MLPLHKLGNPGLEGIRTHLEFHGGYLTHWDLNSSPDYDTVCFCTLMQTQTITRISLMPLCVEAMVQ